MPTISKIKIQWEIHDGKEHSLEDSLQVLKTLVEASKVGNLLNLSPLSPKEPKKRIKT
jgi:hypothetical protein